MTDDTQTPAPPPIGLLVQPQPALGRVVVAIMQGPLMLAHVWFEDPAQLDQIIGQMAGARVETFGLPEGAQVGEPPERDWACKVGDDCTCATLPHPGGVELCDYFQGRHQ